MTSEQIALLRKSQESLSAARLLLSQKHFDFAVSRAYYGMFYVVEALLLGDGLTFSKHSAVLSAFGKQFVKTGKAPEEFHQYLVEGHENRNISDYDTGPGLSKEQAEKQISHAEMFLQLAEKLLGRIPPLK